MKAKHQRPLALSALSAVLLAACACGSNPAAPMAVSPMAATPEGSGALEKPAKSGAPSVKTASVAPWSSTLPVGSVLRAAAFDREGDVVLAPTMGGAGTIGKASLPRGLSLLALKIDGTQRWQRHLTGDSDSFVRSIKIRANGDFILAGSFAGKLAIDGHTVVSHGDRDAFVLVLSQEGKVIWMQSLGGPAREQASSIAISEDQERIAIGGWAESSFRFAGKELSARGTAKDGFVAVYDASGKALWAKRYVGVGVDEVHDLAYEGGELAVLGSFSSTLRFSPDIIYSHGERDLFCIRYDEEGARLWLRTWGSDKDERGIALQVGSKHELRLLATVEGELLIDDAKLPTIGSSDLLFLVLDANGDTVVKKRHGSGGHVVATHTQGTADWKVAGYYQGAGKFAHLKLPEAPEERGLLLHLGSDYSLVDAVTSDFDRLLVFEERFGFELQIGLRERRVQLRLQTRRK